MVEAKRAHTAETPKQTSSYLRLNAPHFYPDRRYSPHTKKRNTMRILLNVKIPHQPFNAAVKDGTAGSMLSRILEAIKPEAVYFTERNGKRGAVLIVDLPDPSKIPALAEPWFLTFQADVEFRVVMSPDDLKRAGLNELGKKWS